MGAIILIALAFGLAMFPTLRCALFHPVSLIRFGVLDLRDHFRHHEYDRCGSVDAFLPTKHFCTFQTVNRKRWKRFLAFPGKTAFMAGN